MPRFSQTQQAAEKLVDEANRSAAEAERINQRLAQKFQMLQLQSSQRDNQATMQSAGSQSVKHTNMHRLQKMDDCRVSGQKCRNYWEARWRRAELIKLR